MKRLLYAFGLAILSVSLLAGQLTLAQNIATVSQIQTGFAVVTPLQGGGAGLSVSEVFGQEVSGNLFRASVLPSPLVTLTSIFARVDPGAAIDTGIAMTNPNAETATVTLTLNNQQGFTIAVRTVTLLGRQQLSRFVSELFAGTPELQGSFNGLVFISSDRGIGVMGLTFTGPSFTSLPVAQQLTTSNAAIAATTTTGNTVIVSTAGTQQTIASVNTPIAPMTAPVAALPPTVVAPLPSTITQVPSTIIGLTPTQPITATTTPLTTTSPLFTTPSPVGGVTFATTTPTTITSPTAVAIAGGVVITPIPVIALGIGGANAQLLPQVATGGGWVSTIAIANTSTVPQLVRVDFFSADGGPLALPIGSTVTNILVPAGGVVTLSTAG